MGTWGLRHSAHHHLGWPWEPGSLLLPSFFLLLSFLFLWPPRPRNPKWFRSNVISACCFSAGCCHGTVQSDLLYPSVLKKTRIPTGRPPLTFFRRSLGSLLAGLLFFFLILDAVLLLTLLPPQSDRHVATAIEERLVSFSCSPLSLLLKSVWVAYWRHESLFLFPPRATSPPQVLGGFYVHWSLFSRCLLTGNHWLCLWLPTFWTTFTRWSGCASLLAGEELLRGSECWLAACFRLLFHLVSQSPGLVKLPCALQSTGLR